MFIHCKYKENMTPVNVSRYDKILKQHLKDTDTYCIGFYKNGNSALTVFWEFDCEVSRDSYYNLLLDKVSQVL